MNTTFNHNYDRSQYLQPGTVVEVTVPAHNPNRHPHHGETGVVLKGLLSEYAYKYSVRLDSGTTIWVRREFLTTKGA